MPNMMAALLNIGGTPSSTLQSFADTSTRVLCSNAAKTRNPLKLAGVPQTNKTSQPLVGRSSPYCKDVGEILPFNKFFSDCQYVH